LIIIIMHVCMLHLDLGIGGAEKWVVNTVKSLQSQHTVKVFTTFHDPGRAFPET